MTTTLDVRPLGAHDRQWLRDVLASSWGSAIVVTLTGARDASSLAGFVAMNGGERAGVVTYELDGHDCEVVTLTCYVAGRGAGTALLDAVRAVAAQVGCARLWLTTTNDNTAALRFYQRRGWNLVALHRDVLTEWRRLKPGMSELGIDSIPMRHALELELRL